MYLKNYLNQFNDKKIKLFVDMDGVIADYIFDAPNNYHEKRPLYDSIKKLEEISKLPNIELYIISSSRYNEGIAQKNTWLDEHAPFFKKENRIILSREANDMVKSSALKANYFIEHEYNDNILIVIDDDPRVLKEIASLNKDIILLKDTVLVD